MKLTASELAYVRTQGLYITEKGNHCRKLLNQTVRYTIARKPEVYYSANCRDKVFFGDYAEVKKHSKPGKCLYCGVSLKGKRQGSRYCDHVCQMNDKRKRTATGEHELSVTPT